MVRNITSVKIKGIVMGKPDLKNLIEDNEKNQRIAGIVFVVLGAICIIAGITLFIIGNLDNVYAKKMSASVMGASEIIKEDGTSTTMLTLVYKVGNEMVETTYNYEGSYTEEMVQYDGYYDVRNPKLVVEVSWSFVSLWAVLLGAVILVPGLIYLGKIKLPKPKYAKLKDADDKVKKLNELKEQVENSLIPAMGALAVAIFGLVMGLVKGGVWTWVVMGAGLVFTAVFCYYSYGPLKEFLDLTKALKYRGTVVNDALEEAIDSQNVNKGKAFKKGRKKTNKEIAEEVALEAQNEEDDYTKWEKEHYKEEK